MKINSIVNAVIVALGLCSFTAQAEESDIIEEIVVTGSYIKGSPGDAPSPIQTLNRDEIVLSGVSDVAELVRNLEIASGSDTAAQNELRTNANYGAGLANVNLRGVGPTATLVLLDGKRMPFAGQKLSDGDRFVDINSIPITMIQRVEVLKDGGSAIYGSDAIAGVVNFITRSDFTGFEFTTKMQTTSTGSQDDNTYGAIFGWASDDSNTHLVIGGEYFDRGHLLSRDRTDLTRDVFPKQNHTIVNRFSIGNFGPDSQCGALGLGLFPDDGFSADPNSCNRYGSETEVFVPRQKRKSVMATFSHLFNESTELYAQVSRLDSRSGEVRPIHVGPIEPKFALPGILPALLPFGIGSFPFNDPSLSINGGSRFVIPPTFPAALELADYQVRVPGIDADREFDAHNEQNTNRYQVGVTGDFALGDRSWNYDFSYTRGESEFSTHYMGLDKDRLELAHYGLGGPGCTPNGSLANPFARGLLAGADGVFDSTATTPGAVGLLESTFEALMGTVPGLPFINPDNVVIAMTSSNRGDNSQGCYFFNPYLTRAGVPGLTNSEELLRWLEVPLNDAQRSETFLNSLNLVFSGELMDISAGTVSMAFGAQFRSEGRKTTVHPQFIGGVNSFGQLSGRESVSGLSENRNFDAEREISAAFFEFQIPATENIDVQLAGRFEDYGGDIGATFDPKLGVRWQVTDSLVVRSSASSSFRGPGLAQIEEGTGYSLEFGVIDVLGEGSNPLGSNCVRTGRCSFPTGTDIPAFTIVKQGQPTPNLSPEKAITFNIGGIWSPIENLTLGIDYYRIDFTDKIIDVPTQSLLQEELALFNAALAANDFAIAVPGQPDFGQSCDPNSDEFDPGTGARPEACQVNLTAYAISPENSAFVGGRITRRADVTRDLQIISSGALNTGKVETDGLDFNFAYVRDTDSGSWVVDGRLNWIGKFEVKDFPGGQPDFDAAGFTNNDPTRRLIRSMPDLKGNIGLSFFRERQNLRLNVRFIGPYQDNAAVNNRIGDGEIGTYTAVDFTYNYLLNVRDSEVTLTFGVIDLLDRKLPRLKNMNGTDLSVFDTRGRRIYGTVKLAM